MSLLLGPADASFYRKKVGRARHYFDPLPSCDIAPESDWSGPSISTLKPPFANKYVPMKRTAEMPSSEWERMASLEVDDRYELIKTHEKATGQIDMKRGSLLHKRAEDRLLGRQVLPEMELLEYNRTVIEQADRFQPALDAFFDAEQPEATAIEAVCLHRTLNGVGYGGTADAIIKLRKKLWLVDWKSRNSDHAAYLEEAAQGGGYARAEYMIVQDGDGNPVRMKIPDLAGVLIVSIRTDGYRVYPIELDAAVAVFDEMHRWWVAQRTFRESKAIGRPWAPKKIAAGGSSSSNLGSTSDEPLAASNRDRLRDRIGVLLADGHEDKVRAAWPQGVPPLSKDGHTTEQLEALLAMVRKVEAEIGAQFHADDMQVDGNPRPRVDPNPQPVVETVEEGETLSESELGAIQNLLATVPADRRPVIAEIAADAHAAGRSISVSQKPTERRSLLAIALGNWALSNAPYDALWAAVALIATEAQTADPDQRLGALISRFTIDQARSLADTFAEQSAA